MAAKKSYHKPGEDRAMAADSKRTEGTAVAE
jgi:hypothetical protein